MKNTRLIEKQVLKRALRISILGEEDTDIASIVKFFYKKSLPIKEVLSPDSWNLIVDLSKSIDSSKKQAKQYLLRLNTKVNGNIPVAIDSLNQEELEIQNLLK